MVSSFEYDEFISINKKHLNEENKFIEEMIKIKDKYPYVYINVGEKESVPLYISLYTPHILLFPKDNNSIRYDYTTSKTYADKNITTEMSHPQNPKAKIKIRISSETFKYENNNYNFTFSIIDGQKKAGPDNVGGVYGILRDVDKFENITKDVLLIEQLFKKNLINKKIFYISNYFDGDNSLTQAKLLIGKIPEEFDGENKKNYHSVLLIVNWVDLSLKKQIIIFHIPLKLMKGKQL